MLGSDDPRASRVRPPGCQGFPVISSGPWARALANIRHRFRWRPTPGRRPATHIGRIRQGGLMWRFINRTEAGRELATMLHGFKNRNDVVVLGLPRGGV